MDLKQLTPPGLPLCDLDLPETTVENSFPENMDKKKQMLFPRGKHFTAGQAYIPIVESD